LSPDGGNDKEGHVEAFGFSYEVKLVHGGLGRVGDPFGKPPSVVFRFLSGPVLSAFSLGTHPEVVRFGQKKRLSRLRVFLESGGGRRIRTTEGLPQQIYSSRFLSFKVDLCRIKVDDNERIAKVFLLSGI